MSEVLKTNSSDAVSKGYSAARRSTVVFAALASLAILASPIHGAIGAQATQVREVDDPGRIAYESQQSIEGGIVAAFPQVPAGHRLVIQHVSAEVIFQSNVNNLVQVLVFGNGEGSSTFLAPFSVNVSVFDQLVQQYVDAGRTPNVQFIADAGVTAVSSGSVTMTGYLLDCTAAPCATIAH